MSKKTAVITGGANCLGLAVAIHLEEEGFQVNVIDHDADAIRSLASRSPHINGFHADVRSLPDLEETLATIASLTGVVDVLVCAAHVDYEIQVEKTTSREWDEIIETNLSGAMFASLAARPYLTRSSNPVIVHLSSVFARIANGSRAPYSAAMAGVATLSRSLAADFEADNIRCLSLSPYTVLTDVVQEKMAANPACEYSWL